jgi:hypothetical protein
MYLHDVRFPLLASIVTLHHADMIITVCYDCHAMADRSAVCSLSCCVIVLSDSRETSGIFSETAGENRREQGIALSRKRTTVRAGAH